MRKKKKEKAKKSQIIVFILLLVLVITLFIVCIIKNREVDLNKYANMVIPIYEEDTNFEFNINAKVLSEVDEYTFKIVNYRKDKLNEKELNYRIEVNNDTDSIIKVYIDGDDKDLMIDQKQTIFEDRKLSNKEKENIYYHVKMTKKGKLTNKDLIYIKISN